MAVAAPALEDRVERLEVVIDGDPKLDTRGLRKRVEDVETLVKEIRELKLKFEGAMFTIKMLAVLVAVLGASNVVSILMMVNQIMGGVK